MGIRFELKDSQGKYTPIYLVLHYHGKRLKFSTGLSIDPGCWDKSRKRAKYIRGRNDLARLNDKLDNLEREARAAYLERGNASTHELRSFLKSKVSDKPSKNDLFACAKQLYQRLEKENKDWKGMRTTTNILFGYNKNLTFSDIDIGFYKLFILYLQGQDFSKNYIGRHIANIKRIMQEGLDLKYHKNLDWKTPKFKRTEEKVYNIYLTVPELYQLLNLGLTNPGEADARDRFLISCFTGLRWNDSKSLKESDITNDEYITSDTSKTSTRVVIPLHPIIREVLLRRGGQLPLPISNQKQNDHLKTICEKAEIKDPVSKSITKGGMVKTITVPKYKLVATHTARRSMATNMYLAGVPLTTISKLLGHSSIKQTLDYIKLSEVELAQELKTHPFFR